MAAIDLQAGPVHLLVERVDGKAVVTCMDAQDWNWTSALAQGRAFGDLLTEDAAQRVATVLSRHLAAGRLVAFHTDAFDEEALP